MAKKDKILKKSRFLNSVNNMREAIVNEKSNTEKFLYSSRQDYIGKIFKIIMEKKGKQFFKEDLIV